MTFRRLVSMVQVIAVGLTVATAAMLAAPSPVGQDTTTLGATVFARDCASCHGTNGTGLVGPDLTNGHVFERFVSRAEMMRFITEGFEKMPAMGERLTAGEIGAVADYVREELSQ